MRAVIFEVVGMLVFVGMEARIDQVEWNPDDREAVRAAPLVRHEERGTKIDARLGELREKPRDERLERTSFETKVQLVDSLVPEVALRLGQVQLRAHSHEFCLGPGAGTSLWQPKNRCTGVEVWRFCHDPSPII